MPRHGAEVCQYLDWDSAFFGWRIARADCGNLDAHGMRELLSWCRENSIDCLCFLADTNSPQTVRLLENYRFRFVDIRLALECRLSETGRRPRETQPLWSIRRARGEDIPALRAIAKASHRESRFYFDGHFPAPAADALYESWIENSCKGYADVVWVAETQGLPVGYVSCHLLGGSDGQIGLLGVAADWQGNGIGHGLLQRSLEWFDEQSVSLVRVVTQGRNHKAQRLYQRHGFLTQSVQLWYHRWFSKPARG